MTYHQKTEHSYKSVRMNSGFLDWATQPSAFKSYPRFYHRKKLDSAKPLEGTILLAGKITFAKKYGNDEYFLRTWASAGALYPVEMYVQMRSVEGYIDGVYHFEPQSESLALLHELNRDGLERHAALDYDIKGALFLFASPYFRSSWKYKNRALRYCLLDSGHHYGTLEIGAYANGLQSEAVFGFDKLSICEIMGFENKELTTMLAFIGEKTEQKSKEISEKLPFVSPTDYFEQNGFIEEAYRASAEASRSGGETQKPSFDFDKISLLNAIQNRRSIRAFYAHSISKDEYERIVGVAGQSMDGLDIYAVINNVDGVQKGLYKGVELLKAGDFSQKTGYLCLEQALGSRSAVTLFIASAADSYQCDVARAGIYGHRVYIAAAMFGIGVSGIGAYYDGEVKEFLETDKHILYALAIGR
jgi:SagB-type dehydrogenase family enzyme